MAVIDQNLTDEWAIYNGDCIEVMGKMPDNSIHMSIYSPPFGGLYSYSSDTRDLSNNIGMEEFLEHYEYCIEEIERITLPGRITCVHCSDVVSGNSGNDYLIDLPGEVIKLHEKVGWRFIARHTIWKEPLWIRLRTMVKNLSHKCIVDDSSKAGIASADFLLVFRKRGTNPAPVEHPTGLNYYAGECPIPAEFEKYKNFKGDQKQNRYSHIIWQRYASSVWDDIRMNNVLPFKDCKEDDDEKHVHPLMLDIIERAVILRSSPGEIVFTPFMGVGSEVFGAVKNGRKGIGVELKSSYYRQSLANLKSIDLISTTAKNGELPL